MGNRGYVSLLTRMATPELPHQPPLPWIQQLWETLVQIDHTECWKTAMPAVFNTVLSSYEWNKGNVLLIKGANLCFFSNWDLPCLVVSKCSFVGVAFKKQLRNVGASFSIVCWQEETRINTNGHFEWELGYNELLLLSWVSLLRSRKIVTRMQTNCGGLLSQSCLQTMYNQFIIDFL